MSRPLKLLVVAGEVSGDMHAAGLVRALRQREPDLTCFGIGGDQLREAGMEIVRDARDMAGVGFAEILPRLPFFVRTFNSILELARERKPDAVVLVDYPGFNLRLAARAHKMGIKVIYYICPQVWAWHRSRIPKMARIIDRLLVIFPFEKEVFSGTNLKVDYVGHPLIDETREALARPEPALPWGGQPRIAVLPGSRQQVIERMLPVFMDAAAILLNRHPKAGFMVPAPSREIATVVEGMLSRHKTGGQRWTVVTGQARQIVRTATAAMVSAGTATLETGLMGCPMVIAYKMAPLSFFFAKRLVKVDHAGMVNIVAGKTLCPEFIQDAATPDAIANAVDQLLSSGTERARMISGLKEVAAKLGDGGSHARAAEMILTELA
ncbi:MAG: lipid-A-disaccharide synthase [bacterium]